MAVLLLCLSGCGKEAESFLDGFINSKIILTPPTEPITTIQNHAIFTIENRTFHEIAYPVTNILQKKTGDSWETISKSNQITWDIAYPPIGAYEKSTFYVSFPSSITAGEYRVAVQVGDHNDGKPTYAVCYFTIIEK